MKQRLPLGQVYITRNASIELSAQDMNAGLNRHILGYERQTLKNSVEVISDC